MKKARHLVHDLFHAELQSSGSEDLKEALGLGESLLNQRRDLQSLCTALRALPDLVEAVVEWRLDLRIQSGRSALFWGDLEVLVPGSQAHMEDPAFVVDDGVLTGLGSGGAVCKELLFGDLRPGKLLQRRQHLGYILTVRDWPVEWLLERVLKAVVWVELERTAGTQKDCTVTVVAHGQLGVVPVAEETPQVRDHHLEGQGDGLLQSESSSQAEADKASDELGAVLPQCIHCRPTPTLNLQQRIAAGCTCTHKKSGGHVADHEVVHHCHPIGCWNQDQGLRHSIFGTDIAAQVVPRSDPRASPQLQNWLPQLCRTSCRKGEGHEGSITLE
mmetsp:Transcript_78989/g.189680  ORF Transcript_78989/g.189680 Transcript_78989/m.189680 type:complete len:330 (-) Transcript_78989:678-1667(-)